MCNDKMRSMKKMTPFPWFTFASILKSVKFEIKKRKTQLSLTHRRKYHWKLFGCF